MNKTLCMLILLAGLAGCVGLAFDEPFAGPLDPRPWGDSFKAAGRYGDWRDQVGR